MQERRNSIANALELHLSCSNPSISPSQDPVADLLDWASGRGPVCEVLLVAVVPWVAVGSQAARQADPGSLLLQAGHRTG